MVNRKSFKRFSLRKTPKAPEQPDTWGQFGLNLLHSPLNPLIDFIFVHGLRGGSIKTWAKSGNLERYWPKAWLPQDPNLQYARIHSFGYNSDWGGDTGDANLDIHDFGRSLFGEMRTSPELRNGKPNPIVLIGHSMGGLVIKKDGDRIQCIFFLATPHRGSDAAKMLDRILRATTGTKPYVGELNRNSGTIASINDAFRHHTDKLEIWSFYETMKTKKGGNSIMVVDRESAVIGAPHEHINPLNADHIGACKFESPDDPNYVLIKNSLAKAAEDLLIGAQVVESSQQLASLEEYLLIQHYPEDDLDMIESKKIAGSCGWITSLQSMTAWRDSLEQGMMVHWLSGQAGVGKSVLIAHMIRHLEQSSFDTCYYFFRDGRKAQQTVSGFLRSLAYQMAVIHSSVREALSNLREAGVVLDGDDERVIWRKVFVQCIFTIPISTAQFWVVDGLDECLDISKLFSLLARVEARFLVRLHLSSRRVPELEKLMYRLKHPLHHHIEVEDTVPDIKQFIETRAHELPVEDQNRHELVEKLVTKSRGVFLWAELACEELGQVFYEDEIDAALERVPAGMSPLYNKILESMEKDTKHKPLIQAVLEWTVCATRPMTIEELQAALSFDRRSKVHNVRKIVEQLCGQLLRIDNDVVQMIHATARVFLLDPSSATSFAMDKATVNQRLATVCLEYLAGSEMRPPRHPMLLSTPVSLSEFANYASISWSDHIESSPPILNELSSLVDKFFRTNVLAWVEYILNNKASLYYLARVSKNLDKYLDGFAKDVSVPEAPHGYLQRWVTDLMRLALRFGEDLLRDPAAIHFIVPQLCPKNSAIHQQFAQTSYGPRIKGLTDPDWDDCVSYIDYRDSMALCLASCEEKFAIGMMSGTVRIYREATCQIHATLDHGEPVNVLQFDGSSERLVSSGRKLVKLWTVDGSLIWSISVKDPFVAVAFVQSDQVLSAVDRGSSVVFLNSQDGSSSADILVCSPSRRRPPQIVTSADICPEGKLVALAYRGKPAQIWSTERNVMIKECHMARDQIGVRTMPVSQILFNPNPAIEILAIAHQDLELSIFDKWSNEGNEIKSLPGDALTLAATPDGRTLGTGDATGTIKLWDFETLTLLCCVKSNECEVKSLAFSGDGFKLYDIRDTKTRVWEPWVLVRRAISEEGSVGDSVTTPTPIIGLQRDDFSITCITAPAESECVFAGRDDGSVLAYDWVSGAAVATLYTHKTRQLITKIACNSSFIASVDLAGRLEVYALTTIPQNRFHATKTAYQKAVHGLIKTLEMHPTEPWLLISQSSLLALVNLDDGTEQPIVPPGHNIADYSLWTWSRRHGETVLFGARAGSVDALSVAEGGEINLRGLMFNDISPTSRIVRLHCSADGKYVAVLVADGVSTRNEPMLLVYRSSAEIVTGDGQADHGTQIDPILALPSYKFKTFYGFHGDHIIFLDRDRWVWAVDLKQAEKGIALESIAKRYFVIPREFIGGNNGVDGVLTAACTIAFPKDGELAVGSFALDWPYMGTGLYQTVKKEKK
ncbi:NACHT and WD domain [Fusarium albosuccineum]|uniref:NACHT and WD domain n=1 Tax=Fusarium albosuccineum TaxID=1237068 RepID=A0A8H4LND4_9HYPO|nr:NACHT and WD domain [Fusarium albosuccineum]